MLKPSGDLNFILYYIYILNIHKRKNPNKHGYSRWWSKRLGVSPKFTYHLKRKERKIAVGVSVCQSYYYFDDKEHMEEVQERERVHILVRTKGTGKWIFC